MRIACAESGRLLGFAPQFWLQWHITDRCSGRCQHCYLDRRRPDLPWSKLETILDKYQAYLAAIGSPGRLQIAGGEPLLSPHLFALLSAAARLRLPARLLSSGLGLTPELADRLGEHRVRIVQISVEGTEEQHDAVRGKGSYQLARAACRTMTEAGIEVTVAATLHAGNRGALSALRRDFCGIARRVHGARLVPVGEGSRFKDALLSPRDWHGAMQQALGERPLPGAPELLLKDPTWAGIRWSGRSAQSEYVVSGCSAGFAGLCVDTDGTAYPCRRMPIPVGDLLEQDLETIFRHPLMRALRDRDRLEGACGRCGLRWHCGGCRAVAWAVHGSPLAPDPQCPWPAMRRAENWREMLGFPWWSRSRAEQGSATAG